MGIAAQHLKRGRPRTCLGQAGAHIGDHIAGQPFVPTTPGQHPGRPLGDRHDPTVTVTDLMVVFGVDVEGGMPSGQVVFPVTNRSASWNRE